MKCFLKDNQFNKLLKSWIMPFRDNAFAFKAADSLNLLSGGSYNNLTSKGLKFYSLQENPQILIEALCQDNTTHRSTMELMIRGSGKNYNGRNVCERLQANERHSECKVASPFQLNTVISWVCSCFWNVCVCVCVSSGLYFKIQFFLYCMHTYCMCHQAQSLLPAV